MIEHIYVATDEELQELCTELETETRLALDTEFHRERTYYPQLALIQIAWSKGLALIDPLETDVGLLKKLFEDENREIVMHACSQDIEVLNHSVGASAKNIFDTQIAGGFLGMKSPSLGALHDVYLQKRLAKSNRLTNWLKRPLDDSQRNYAASDVADLLEIRDLLEAELREKGRYGWFVAECQKARDKAMVIRDPDEIWRRIKEARGLSAIELARVQALARWRELTARERDVPVRQVLPDLGIVALAQKAPTNAQALKSVRGMQRRPVSNHDAQTLIELIAEVTTPIDIPKKNPNRGKRSDLRPAVTLVSAWLSQFCDDIDIDTALVGTRADIEEYVRDSTGRLTKGWRHQLVGEAITAILNGQAAIAFAGDGRVVVEERSYQPVSNKVLQAD